MTGIKTRTSDGEEVVVVETEKEAIDALAGDVPVVGPASLLEEKGLAVEHEEVGTVEELKDPAQR